MNDFKSLWCRWFILNLKTTFAQKKTETFISNKLLSPKKT